MRVAIAGTILGFAILSAVIGSGWQRSVNAQQVPQFGNATAQGDLIALPGPITDSHQQITVIDRQARTMSVYHIEAETGEISLRSCRNIRWDLAIEQYNSDRPSPKEIRSLLQVQ